MKIERRSTMGRLGRCRIHKRADGTSWLTGYAAVFYDPRDRGTQYDIFEGHVERVDRSAFDDTDWTQTVSVFNHDFKQVPLGTTRSGTLSVEVDDVGVKYRVKLPQSATSVREAVERGDIAGSSFSWPPDAWTVKRSNDGDFTVHTITKIDRVMDVSPCTWPAYTATSAEMADADGLGVSFSGGRGLLESQANRNRARAAAARNHVNPSPWELPGRTGRNYRRLRRVLAQA